MRQFMLQLPRELDEAALVDGASWPRIYWSVIMPLMGAGIGGYGDLLPSSITGTTFFIPSSF